jgi:hypothetical protein
MEEWVSLTEYCKRYKMNQANVKHLIHEGKLEAVQTQKGHYKIKINGDSVSREQYEELLKRCVLAETQLNFIKQIVGG